MTDSDLQFLPRWTTKQAADMANISNQMIRKYAQVLSSECNYEFQTINGRDRRYCDHDITLFIEMKRLSDETGMVITHIAQMVYDMYSVSDDEDSRYAESEIAASEESTDIEPRYPDDLSAIVTRASRQFWQAAREEIVQDVRGVIREEVRAELQTEMDGLKQHLTHELQAVRDEVAASHEQERKPWWKFGK
ncbi:hypothetical protein [Alicyclobacillus ferrooxydans]|uniref:HTH merR-type domain-containing protein n=1 Tax=Alicyclobacillus ferrooxydans TaxID=471514 RepID=A0A0P9F2X9_9BACL|nr:hypothetical protein [Alicyclobacillus ferrooxydans]KPV45777.1 hypothetical protein AN477_00110 [Alicyclobacillus ferrooxydans]